MMAEYGGFMFGLRRSRCVQWVIVVIMIAGPSSIRAAAPSSWPNACGDGRVDVVVDDFEEAPLWEFCCSDRGLPIVGIEPGQGCSGGALAVNYDLNGGDWFVIWRSFSSPIDLSDMTHLRLALRSGDQGAHHNFQIKLVNSGASGDHIYWVVAESTVDLPVWRPLYFDLREFRCGNEATCASDVPFNPAAVTRIEVAVARCLRNGEECEQPVVDEAVLFLDELAAVNLRPGGPHRLSQTEFERLAPSSDLRASTGRAILEHQDPDNGLVPAWFDEASPNYNTYAQAIALHVLVDEYRTTRDRGFKNAAKRLAESLLGLQSENGFWFTDYKFEGGKVVPRDPTCTGGETEPEDVDRCSWVGNTAWAVIALDRARNGKMGRRLRAKLDASIEQAVSWMRSQIGRIDEYPELITVGLEGNISSYFGLLAGRDHAVAQGLGEAIYRNGWDPEQERMKIGAGPADFATAMDTAGSWGTTLLMCLGRKAEALSSQGYAATVLRTISFGSDNAAGRFLTGYGDIAGPFTITSEFAAQGAAVGIMGSSHVMGELLALQNSEGAFPGSTDDWYGGQIPPWTTTWTGVSPTAWVYFVQSGDPLLALCPCNAAKKVRATLKRDGMLIAKVRVRKSRLPEGSRLTFDNSCDQPLQCSVDSRGRCEVEWNDQTGPCTVSLVGCPDSAKEVGSRRSS